MIKLKDYLLLRKDNAKQSVDEKENDIFMFVPSYPKFQYK